MPQLWSQQHEALLPEGMNLRPSPALSGLSTTMEWLGSATRFMLKINPEKVREWQQRSRMKKKIKSK